MRIWGSCAVALSLFFAASGVRAADEVTTISIVQRIDNIVVAADGSSVRTIHTALHADNDAGAMRLSQVQLGFDSAHQKLQILDAYTLKPDGTKLPVDMSAIYERLPQDDAKMGMVTDRRVKVVIFPQMAAGDTAVYTVKYTNGTPIFPGKYTFGAAFSTAAPIKDARTTITAPRSMHLRAETHGVPFKEESRGEDVVYSWHYAVPVARPQKKVAVSPLDELPRFFVSNFKDYAELGNDYNTLAGGKIAVTPKVAALAEKLAAGVSDPREQARLFYDWITTHVRYVAIELGAGTIVPHNVDDILAHGYGDCKDHDVLMRSLLLAKGVASQSVLLNPSNAYTLTKVPTFTQIDHVITYVPSLDLYLDSSTSTTPFGSLPYGEYGKPAVYVSAQGAKFGTMPVLPPGLASEHTTNVMRLDGAGVLTGTMTTTAAGPSQTVLRLVGLAMQVVSPEKIAAEQLSSRGYRGGKGTLKAGPPLVPGKSYTVTGTYSVPGWGEWLTGRKVSFMPIGLRVLGLTGDGPLGPLVPSNPNDASPVPCFSVHQSEVDSLQIPAGTRFDSIPVDARVKTRNFEFTAKWSVSGNTVTVRRDFVSHMDKPLCTGALRKQTIRALLAVATTYLGQIRIVPATTSTPYVSQNTPPIGPSPVGGQGRVAFNDAAGLVKLAEPGHAAQAIVTMAAADHPETPTDSYPAHLVQGLAYLQNSQLAQAIAELSEAIRLNPAAGAQTYGARAEAYSRIGKKKLAVADLDRALKSTPDDLELRRMHARLLIQMRDYDGAVADYNIVVGEHPDDAMLRVARANARYRADKYDEAEADFWRAHKLGAPDHDVKLGLCNSLARTENFALAVGHCNWTLKHDGRSGAGLESRGYAYFRLGKFARALKDFDTAVAAYPEDARYLYERGVAKAKTGDMAGGKRDMAAATKMSKRVARRVPAAMRPGR